MASVKVAKRKLYLIYLIYTSYLLRECWCEQTTIKAVTDKLVCEYLMLKYKNFCRDNHYKKQLKGPTSSTDTPDVVFLMIDVVLKTGHSQQITASGASPTPALQHKHKPINVFCCIRAQGPVTASVLLLLQQWNENVFYFQKEQTTNEASLVNDLWNPRNI